MTFYGTFASGAGWIVPKNYVEKVGDDGFKKHPIGPRSVQVRQQQAGHRAGDGGVRGLLAQGAVGEAPGLQEHPGVDHAAGHAEARRGRRRLSAGRLAGRGGEARSEAEARLLRRHRHVLSRLPRHVGPEVAVGRPARAAGREPRDRPPGASARPRRSAPRQPTGNVVPRRPSSSRCRSSPIRTIRRRPRSCWPRRAIRTASTPAICIRWPPYFSHRRGDHRLSRRGRHQGADAHDGARRVLCRAWHEEAEGRCACA